MRIKVVLLQRLLCSMTIPFALLSSEDLLAENNEKSEVESRYDFSDFRKSPDQHGLGFGLLSTRSSGAFIFYDYNDHENSKQYHIQLNSAGDSRQTLLGKTVAKLAQSDVVGSYRHTYIHGRYQNPKNPLRRPTYIPSILQSRRLQILTL